MNGWLITLYIVIGMIIGGIIGFLGARAYILNQQKKNPPINEKMIRAMYMSMGRKPSEADIRRTMNSIRMK